MPITRLLLLGFLLAFCSCKNQPKENTPVPQPAASLVVPANVTLPEAIFTDLNKVALGTSSTKIMDRLIDLVNATPENRAIHLSIFLFKYPDLVLALKAANKRGVQLHLMIDLSRSESIEENPLAIAELRSALKENAEIITVKNDAANSAINHNKFVLFSEVKTTKGVEKNVVFQTSHNFNLTDTRKIQDAVTIADAGLYTAYQSYWQDMKAKAERGMKDYEYREYYNEASGIQAFFLPKRKSGTAYGDDSVIELFNKITDPATTTIRIGMSDWVSSRINIVNKLKELQEQGAALELVVKSSIDDDILLGLRELEQQGAYLKVYNMTNAAMQKVNIHSKFLLIDGQLSGKTTQLLVVGSHNFTQNALRNNNETMVLFWNTSLYGSYLTTFNQLKNIPGI